MIIDRGAIFCHVERASAVLISRPCKTSGSHECTGAIPIFKANETIINVTGRFVGA